MTKTQIKTIRCLAEKACRMEEQMNPLIDAAGATSCTTLFQRDRINDQVANLTAAQNFLNQVQDLLLDTVKLNPKK